ncbi:MAG: hypothetical protein ACRDTH_16830, partial [Pseudonocardiaceae bacterium]
SNQGPRLGSRRPAGITRHCAEYADGLLPRGGMRRALLSRCGCDSGETALTSIRPYLVWILPEEVRGDEC